jgi:uncharacterized membrane protein HdeD (DUF308 family)
MYNASEQFSNFVHRGTPMTSRSQNSVWYFAGFLLLISGVVATASSLVNRDATGRTVFLGELHSDIVWGLLLLAVGAFSCFRFNPKNLD